MENSKWKCKMHGKHNKLNFKVSKKEKGIY